MNKEVQIKNSLIYVLPKTVTAIFPFFALAIYTRFLSTHDFGVFALATACAIFLMGVVNFGMIVGFERNFFEYSDERAQKELLYSVLFFVLIMFIFIASFTYAWRDYLSMLIIRSSEYGHLIFVLFCGTTLASFHQYYLTYFRNEEKPKKFMIYTVIFSFLNVFFPIILIVFFHKGIMGLAWGQLIASLVIFLALSVRFLKKQSFSLNLIYLKDAFKISYPLTPRIFFGVINSHINIYILSIINSVSGAGLFFIGQKFANAIFIFMTTLQNVFNPRIYKIMFSGSAGAGKEVGRYLTPFLFFSTACALIISLFSEEVLLIFTSKEFHGAVGVLSVLSIYYAILFFGKITPLQLIFKKKTFIAGMMTFFTIGLNVVIAIPLAKKFGVMGVAWATLFVGILASAVSFIIAQRFFEIEWEYRKVFSMFFVLFFSSVLLLIFFDFQMPYVFRLGFKFLFLALYCFLGVKMKILTRENLSVIMGIITLKKNRDKSKSPNYISVEEIDI